MLKCYLLDTGYCLSSESLLMRGGRRKTVACHALVALLRHPDQGWWLWDTGYAPRLLEATRRLPYRVYRWITPLRLSDELTVAAQLPRLGLTPDDIQGVILSHFHADHVAGLRDFPAAEPIVLESAYADVSGRRGVRAIARAFVPSLLPDDFASRARLLPRFDGPAVANLGPGHDLFGDGSAWLVELPGHARGQMGLLAQTEQGPLFLAADSCWLSQAYREDRPPHWITNVFIDNVAVMRQTLHEVHQFWRARPDVLIVPTHCPEVFAAHLSPTASGRPDSRPGWSTAAGTRWV